MNYFCWSDCRKKIEALQSKCDSLNSLIDFYTKDHEGQRIEIQKLKVALETVEKDRDSWRGKACTYESIIKGLEQDTNELAKNSSTNINMQDQELDKVLKYNCNLELRIKELESRLLKYEPHNHATKPLIQCSDEGTCYDIEAEVAARTKELNDAARQAIKDYVVEHLDSKTSMIHETPLSPTLSKAIKKYDSYQVRLAKASYKAAQAMCKPKKKVKKK